MRQSHTASPKNTPFRGDMEEGKVYKATSVGTNGTKYRLKDSVAKSGVAKDGTEWRVLARKVYRVNKNQPNAYLGAWYWFTEGEKVTGGYWLD